MPPTVEAGRALLPVTELVPVVVEPSYALMPLTALEASEAVSSKSRPDG